MDKNACNTPKVYENVPQELADRVNGMVTTNKRFLFMKGDPTAPMCGFSAQVVKVLNGYGVEFGSFDILSDQEVRYAVKIISNWPTYPQLYVNGKLVGGCDILMEMHEDGELEEALT